MNPQNDPRLEQMDAALNKLVMETVDRIDELYRETKFRAKIIHNIYCNENKCEQEFAYNFGKLVGQEMDMRATIEIIQEDPSKAGIGVTSIQAFFNSMHATFGPPPEENYEEKEPPYGTGLYL